MNMDEIIELVAADLALPVDAVRLRSRAKGYAFARCVAATVARRRGIDDVTISNALGWADDGLTAAYAVRKADANAQARAVVDRLCAD